MKRIFSICLVLMLTLLPVGSIFANESDDIGESVDVSGQAPLAFIPNDNSNSKNARISVSGSGGTAVLDYGSSAKQLIWRITSSTGPIKSFVGEVYIYQGKNKLKGMYPIMITGPVTKTGTINVSWLKRGSYRAVLTGSGTTSQGRIIVKNGVSINFTR